MSEASGRRITARGSLYRRVWSREEIQRQNKCTLHAWSWSTIFRRQTISRRGIRVNYIYPDYVFKSIKKRNLTSTQTGEME